MLLFFEGIAVFDYSAPMFHSKGRPYEGLLLFDNQEMINMVEKLRCFVGGY